MSEADDMRDILKRAILSEGGVLGGAKAKKSKAKKAKKSKKANGGSGLALLGPVEGSDRLVSLVKQIIQDEIKEGGLFIAPRASIAKRHGIKAGFHGCHPMEYESDHECKCGGMRVAGGPVSGALGAGTVSGAVKSKRKLNPGLYPHNAAMKALKGIKFPSREERQAVLNHLAAMYDHSMTRPQNVSFMRDYIAQHI